MAEGLKQTIAGIGLSVQGRFWDTVTGLFARENVSGIFLTANFRS